MTAAPATPATPATSATPATPATPEVPATLAPAWLLAPDPGICPCVPIGRRKRGSFLEKTLGGGARLLRQVMFSQDTAVRAGVLQRLDPRVKLVGMLVLLVALGLVHHLTVLVAAYAATLLLAAASRLPLGSFVKRVWLFVPIFTGVMLLPATLSIVTPGDVVVQLWTSDGRPGGLTAQGLASAGLVVARVACSVSLVVLVTLSTPWVRLLAGLGALGVPRIFVLIIGMAYRYVFLLLGTVTDMYTARKARTVSPRTHQSGSRAFLAASTGAVFGKAHHLSEEVHQAMVARGYRGDAHTVTAFRLTAIDLAAAVATLLCAVAVYGGDRLLGR